VDPELLALLAPCYLALQLGDRTLATEIVAAWEAEVHRLRAAVEHYAVRLRHELRWARQTRRRLRWGQHRPSPSRGAVASRSRAGLILAAGRQEVLGPSPADAERRSAILVLRRA
jgi:hypothetical protein